MKLPAIFLVCALIVSLSFPAASAASTAVSGDSVVSIDLTKPDESDQLWKITMKAAVVSNRSDALVVYLANPQNTAIQNGDETGHLQTIPVSKASSAADAQGNPLDLNEVLPGQEVRITFLYYWRSNTSPRSLVPQSCMEVALTGDTKTAKSFATIDSFDRDVLTGTVLSVQNAQVELYVESGRVFYGDTEYLVRGVQRFAIDNATIQDSEGRAIASSRIQPMQRISVTAADALWMESYPPQYTLQSAAKMELINDGEKLFRPNELAASGIVICTVQEITRDANGNIQLVVIPDENSRERTFCERYVISASPGFVYGSEGTLSTFGSIRTGMKLRVAYTGLIYSSETGQIPWFHRIDLLS